MNDESIKQELNKRIEDNPNFFPKPISDEDTQQHLVNLALSIIRTRDGIGPQGGGFVTAVVKNDLEGAISRGDSDCINAISFFVNVKMHYFPNGQTLTQWTSNFDTLNKLFNEATKIIESDISWESKYDLILSKEISKTVATIIDIDYYDPDTTYEEDVTAYYEAFKRKMQDV